MRHTGEAGHLKLRPGCLAVDHTHSIMGEGAATYPMNVQMVHACCIGEFYRRRQLASSTERYLSVTRSTLYDKNNRFSAVVASVRT